MFFVAGGGFGMCWPSIVHRTVRFTVEDEQALAAAAVGIVQRMGYAVRAAAAGIAANASGLASGMTAARSAGFRVFAAFIPVLIIGMLSGWRLTDEVDEVANQIE
ncbi:MULTISPECIES: hypothetical protein [unclassified Acidisoma]|uniref:hypothetical protein n=1 Tax=unclassified Acidisoma TaxID=2634065 RepID=UPI00131AE26F|nr:MULTISPECIES: hypothetical protein [unclassified Acidisoma]